MKKKWITALLSLMFICSMGYVKAEGMKDCTLQDLPREAQTFVTSHFTGINVAQASHKDSGESKVKLANGSHIQFDRSGNWYDIESETHKALPSSVVKLLPQQAHNYITQNYPNAAVYEMEKDRRGYEVNLHAPQKVELYFDAVGNLLRENAED